MRQAAMRLVPGDPDFMVIPRRPRLAVIHGPGSDPAPLPAGRRSRIVAVTGARRGLGRTTVALHLAAALTRHGRVLLIDADTDHGRVAERLGLQPGRSLGDVFEGHCAFAEAMTEGPRGLRVLAASGAGRSRARLDPFRRWRLCQALPGFQFDQDFVILCLPPGAGADVLELAGRADEVLAVVTPESAFTTRTEALLRGLTGLRDAGPLLVINRIEDPALADAAADRILRAPRPENSRPVEVAARIPEDPTISQVVTDEEFAVQVQPSTAAAGAFLALARRLQSVSPATAIPAVLSAGIGPGSVPGTGS